MGFLRIRLSAIDWSVTRARKGAQSCRVSPLTLRDNFRVLVRGQSTLALLLIDLEGVVP